MSAVTLNEITYFPIYAIAVPAGLLLLGLIVAVTLDTMQNRGNYKRYQAITKSCTGYDYHNSLDYTLLNVKNFHIGGGIGVHTCRRHVWVNLFLRKPLNIYSTTRRWCVLFLVIFGPTAVIGWFYDNTSLTVKDDNSQSYSDLLKCLWVGAIASSAATVVAWVVEATFMRSTGRYEDEVVAYAHTVSRNDPSRAIVFMSEWDFNVVRFPYWITILMYLVVFLLYQGTGAALWYTTYNYNAMSQVWKYCGAWVIAVLLHIVIVEPLRLLFLIMLYQCSPPPPRNPRFEQEMMMLKMGTHPSNNEPQPSVRTQVHPMVYERSSPSMNPQDASIHLRGMNTLGGYDIFDDPRWKPGDERFPVLSIPPLPRREALYDSQLEHVSIVNAAKEIARRQRERLPIWPIIDEHGSQSQQQNIDLIDSLQLRAVGTYEGQRYVIEGHRGIVPAMISIHMTSGSDMFEHEHAGKFLPKCMLPKEDVDERIEQGPNRPWPLMELDYIPPPPSTRPPPKTKKGDRKRPPALLPSAPPPNVEGSLSPMSPGGTVTSGPEASTPSIGMTPTPADLMKMRVSAMYTQYAPEKLPQLDVVMDKFRGNEDELMRALTEKYGPEPVGIPLPPGAANALARRQSDVADLLAPPMRRASGAGDMTAPPLRRPSGAGDMTAPPPRRPSGAGDMTAPPPRRPSGAGDRMAPPPRRLSGAGDLTAPPPRPSGAGDVLTPPPPPRPSIDSSDMSPPPPRPSTAQSAGDMLAPPPPPPRRISAMNDLPPPPPPPPR